MNHERSGAASRRPTIVVADGLSARQWELHLAAAEIDCGVAAWATPDIATYPAWLESLWLAGAEARTPPLTPGQSHALWRRVIAESSEAGELIAQEGVAAWAAAAWELLHRWQIDPLRERAGAGQLDYRALLGWCRSYRERLEAHGWVDRVELETRLATSLPPTAPPVLLTDLEESHPAREALLARLAASGIGVGHQEAPAAAQPRQRTVRLADTVDELRAALTWARSKLDANPTARVAVVVAGLAERRAEVERVAAAILGPDRGLPVWNGGAALGTDATLGAAFNALTLLAPGTPCTAFGGWLRSRAFAASPAERAGRALLETQLRTELRSQTSFATAYRQCGLAALLDQKLPLSGQQIRAALAVVGATRRATPGRWAHLWSRCLIELGWTPPPTGPRLLGWQSALDELARLTPVLGELSIDAALFELESILASPAPAPAPVRGVHLLSRIEQVGPGYAAAWATGFTDAFWPEAPHGNPLLPRALQRAHGMPRSTPQDARDRSARALERLVRRVPDLIVSWPARVYDYETEPSPAIRAWPLATKDLVEPLDVACATGPRRTRHTVPDPPPAFSGTNLPGGASMLNRQAGNPLLAFCRYRLRARPLEPIGFGLSNRLRGIAVHRALEQLLEHLPAQAALSATSEGDVARAAERGLNDVFASARRPLRALYDLEVEQLMALLAAWLDAERARAPFEVMAVEQRRTVHLDRWTLQVRIDRLDRLADGTVAVIDYKTGDRATSADWFAPRLREAQVPLYAIQAADTLGAAVIARVRPDGTSYSGVWPPDAFRGRSARLAADWPAQVAQWRAQLEELAREFAAGDTRVFLDDSPEHDGAYAPLTRSAELAALARGAAREW
ncbi:MAG TPA: PD-(D/E)XK nuclease family protein [Gammaproteobacteria bacterium]|nr:PD-(D/E)XK nuclease family protein [Gammaproteobacteria bacterium]